MNTETNKELIIEYPWLQVGDDFEYTLLDLCPQGWRNLILDLCDSLKHKPIGYDIFDKYHVAEAKEKYCVLRWYDYLDDFEPMPNDIVDLVMDFEEKSKHICMLCGRDKLPNQDICSLCHNQL